MTAKVPYLAALAGQPTRTPRQPPTLRPPRRLFAEVPAPADIDVTGPTPAASIGAAAPILSGDPPRPAAVPEPRRPEIGVTGDVAPPSAPVRRRGPSLTAVPSNEPAAPATSPAVAPRRDQSPPPTAPASIIADVSRADISPPPAGRAEKPSSRDAPDIAPLVAPLVAHPDPRPLTSWTDSRWGMAVELPQTPSRKDTGGTAPHLQASPGEDQPTSAGPGQPPDLRPPARSAGPVPEAPAPGRRPATNGRPPQVSIGTIEVTVVPPDPPAARPVSRPTPAERPRPVSPSARGPQADRLRDGLRDGLRRWHGIAQG